MNSELYYDETLDGSAFNATQRWLNDTLPLLKQAIADQRAPLQLIAVHSLDDIEPWVERLDHWPNYFGKTFFAYVQSNGQDPLALEACFEQALEYKRQMQHALINDSALQPVVNELIQQMSFLLNQGLKQLQGLQNRLAHPVEDEPLNLHFERPKSERFESLLQTYAANKKQAFASSNIGTDLSLWGWFFTFSIGAALVWPSL
ncbi:hypothetical protein [Thiomicrospira microaerophila]|uniref:hypothetical protein n=1 Tax=Thiomicrospira microaerophila TaxID=406020 RepID=UPI0005C858A8|nr:hypothetical protein [Thiomicrospira microaerophila]